jgi:branched-chain amino acid transport system substrate-binding protein
VMSILFGNDLISFAKQAQSVGFYEQLNNHFISLYDTNSLATLGEAAPIGSDGYERAPFNQIIKNEPTGKKFVEAYKASSGRYPSDWTTQGYECVIAWSQAAAKANSIEADAIIKAIETNDFDLPRGTFKFGEYDHQFGVPVYVGKVVNSDTYHQPIVDISTILPSGPVRPSQAELETMRAK